VRHTLPLSRASVGVASSTSRTLSMSQSTSMSMRPSTVTPQGPPQLLGAVHIHNNSVFTATTSAVSHCTDTLSIPTPCSAMRHRTAASLPPYALLRSHHEQRRHAHHRGAAADSPRCYSLSPL
jgi:hypothetical protein